MADWWLWCPAPERGRVQVLGGRRHRKGPAVLCWPTCGQGPLFGTLPELQETQWRPDGILLWGMSPKPGHSGGEVHQWGERINHGRGLSWHISSKDDNEFPHAWKGAITCFSVGLGIMVTTLLIQFSTEKHHITYKLRWWLWHSPCSPPAFATACSAPYSLSWELSRLQLLSPWASTFIFLSTFPLFQSFAAVLFTLGLLAYPAGWGSKEVCSRLYKDLTCCIFSCR